MLESEAKSLVEKKISLPAYDQCLKASHIFNVLDARGAISVAQRAEYIGRIREITKSVLQFGLIPNKIMSEFFLELFSEEIPAGFANKKCKRKTNFKNFQNFFEKKI